MAKGKFDYWLSEEGLFLLSGWARDGLTDEDIAKNVGIVTSTLYEWKKRFPVISEALKKSKEVADRIIENALYKRAKGYDQEVTKAFQYRGEPLIVKIVEHVNPDTTAAIFWLKNRQPQKWGNKQSNIDSLAGINTGVVILPAMLPEPEPPDSK